VPNFKAATAQKRKRKGKVALFPEPKGKKKGGKRSKTCPGGGKEISQIFLIKKGQLTRERGKEGSVVGKEKKKKVRAGGVQKKKGEKKKTARFFLLFPQNGQTKWGCAMQRDPKWKLTHEGQRRGERRKGEGDGASLPKTHFLLKQESEKTRGKRPCQGKLVPKEEGGEGGKGHILTLSIRQSSFWTIEGGERGQALLLGNLQIKGEKGGGKSRITKLRQERGKKRTLAIVYTSLSS